MNFYNTLSKVYDVIFPEDEEVTEFLCKDLKKQSDVLDLACGTGSYAIALGNRGYRVTGVDLDSTMIDLAIKKDSKSLVNFIAEDMLTFTEKINKEKYNMVYCVGNSLVHLEGIEAVKALSQNVYNILYSQGEFLLQIINFDRILDNNIKSLPTIERKEKGISFQRNYNRVKDKIEFKTILFVQAEGQKYENSVGLLPIRSKELKEILLAIGFSKVEVYGDFSGKKYEKEDYLTVIRAIK